jgi:hypothetical protein
MNTAWVPLALVERAVPAITAAGVSPVATGRQRSAQTRTGFLDAYRRAGGDVERMAVLRATPGTSWAERRAGFVARHVAQATAAGEAWWTDDGEPTRRHLALIAWAYTPTPKRFRTWVHKQTRKNPLEPSTTVKRGWDAVTVPPGFTPSRKAHFMAEDTRYARRVAARVLNGEGTLLGAGNFGAVYHVVADGQSYAVKIGERNTVHSRHFTKLMREDRTEGYERSGPNTLRTLNAMKWTLQHEAGIANALTALGCTIVPRTVYVEIADRPILVREYGSETGVTPREYDQLAEQLYAVHRSGFRVSDDLLVLRRLDGSLFIADVGVWSKPLRSPDEADDRSLDTLLRNFSTAQPWARGESIPARPELARVREEYAKYMTKAHRSPLWAEYAQDSAKEIEVMSAKRRAVGLPV